MQTQHTEGENMSNTIDLINAIESGKTRNLETMFSELVQSRVDDALEYRKMEMAQSMFAESEVVEENFGPTKTDYTATSEPSAFDGGHRPHVVNTKTGKTSYLGQESYKTKEHAVAHADAFLKALTQIGSNAADRAGKQYAKINKEHLNK
jgi:hypothetical protein